MQSGHSAPPALSIKPHCGVMTLLGAIRAEQRFVVRTEVGGEAVVSIAMPFGTIPLQTGARDRPGCLSKLVLIEQPGRA